MPAVTSRHAAGRAGRGALLGEPPFTAHGNSFDRDPVDKPTARTHMRPGPNVQSETSIHFVENGSELTAVEIGQRGRLPLIGKLHRVLFALGVVVSTYQVRALSGGIVERLVLQRRDGGAVTGELGARARAAVLGERA